MCFASLSSMSPLSQVPAFSKPISNIVNNTPAGYAYKGVTNQKLSDGIKSGDAYAGLAGSTLIQKQKKSNQFNTAGGF